MSSGLIGRVWYRTRQFIGSLLARVRPDERRLIAEQLAPAQVALFERMPRRDQRHCLDVFHALRQAGHDDASLLQAALLHDVGKAGQGLNLLYRTFIVLMRYVVPYQFERLAADGRGWRSPLAAHARHAAVGAELTAQAHGSADVVWLIRHHHSPVGSGSDDAPLQAQLVALQWADEQH